MFVSFGEVNVDVQGYLFGYNAFLDTTDQGSDAITIGATGSAVGLGTAIAIAGSHNYVENMGEIESVGPAPAIAMGGRNWIDNSGTIVGSYGGISDQGDDAIMNSGRISGTFDTAIFESAGSNEISNTGLISENSNSGNEAISLQGGGNQVTNSGTISSNSLGIVIDSAGNNSINNSGKITATGYSLELYGNANSIVNSGTLDGGITSMGLVSSSSYDIKNDGDIVALANIDTNRASDDAIALAGGGAIVNTGKIESSAIAISNIDPTAADKSTLVNHGVISGGTGGISDTGGHSDAISNYGAIHATDAGAKAIYGDAKSLVTLVNAGTIDGAVDLLDAGPSIKNSGTIDGAVSLGGGHSSLVNTDLIDGAVDLLSSLSSVTNSGTIDGFVSLGGEYSGVVNTDLIDGSVTFSAADDAFINKGRVIGNVIFSGDGNIYSGANGSVSGNILGAGAKGTYIGGAEATTFIFSASGFGADDVVTGGSNDDTLRFSSAGTITAYDLKHVSGVETIDLANGTNAITLSNALVGSALPCNAAGERRNGRRHDRRLGGVDGDRHSDHRRRRGRRHNRRRRGA